MSLVFTGDTFADGGNTIAETLKREHVGASFFLTGNFYRNPEFSQIIRRLKQDGHYLGAHSDKHLLYCSWTNRDSLLVTRQQFERDLLENYNAMKRFGITKQQAPYFLPPYEWYNDSVASWTHGLGLTLINYSPGTLSTADYTTPDMKNYRSTNAIFESIDKAENLNGFILLVHIGTDPKRSDKLYDRLPELISVLKSRNYQLVSLTELLHHPR